MENFDVIIIGGGPAGFTAGIYAARGGVKTAIFTGMQLGGQAALTHIIENYSGIKNAEGFALVNTMMEQATDFGTQIFYSSVEEVDFDAYPHIVKTDDGKVYAAKTIIIATGAKNKLIGLPDEQKLIGKGVSFCATCDGGFFRNKTVAVNGGGDTALTEALYLANICEKVYLIHRRQQFRGAQVLVDRVYANDKIQTVLDSIVTGLVGEPLSGIEVTNKNDGVKTHLNTSALFVAIGYLPNSELFKGKLDMNEQGHIITDENMATNIKTVFAAGDVRNTPLRQVITACGDGAVAANSALSCVQ